MSIPSIVHKPAHAVHGGIKKVPKQVWIIALGGGVVIFLYTRHSGNVKSTTADVQDTGQLPTQGAAGGGLGSPTGDGESYFGDPLPSVDLGGSNGLTGDGPTGDPTPIVVNLIASSADPADSKAQKNSKGKAVKVSLVKTLADLPLATRHKIHDERKAGNYDKYGRTPTERSAARKYSGVKHQLDTRLAKTRAAKAGGNGKTQAVAHTGPKNSPKNRTPKAHAEPHKQSQVKATPKTKTKKRPRAHA